MVRVVATPSQEFALTNCAYCSRSDLDSYGSIVDVNNTIKFTLHEAIAQGCIALSAYQRRNVKVSVGDHVSLARFDLLSLSNLVLVNIELDILTKNRSGGDQIDAMTLSTELRKRFVGQVLTVGQKVPFEYVGINYSFNVVNLLGKGQLDNLTRGLLTQDTDFQLETAGNSGLKIINQRGGQLTNVFKGKDINFQKLGIGGLDDEFKDIFRRAFASRVFPPHIISKLGIPHVKGLLLFGPPGTGKTLIARQIGKMLNGREPKVVNGPEVLSKFVGETEKNVRDLFADAEKDQKAQGDQSDLHIIIFDEIDAICKVCRMEVQIEIGLPHEKGRIQILSIHSNKMKENSFLSADVSLEELASRTKNFSGAELEGLVKSATSFALNRQLKPADLSKQIDEENIKVTKSDFLSALDEVKPAFGAAINTLEMCRLNGMLNCGTRHAHVLKTVKTFVEQVKKSKRTPLLTCLLEGPSGSGKTALAASIGIDSGFPFIKIVSAENMIGLQESTKCAMITKVFEDAYKSPLSIIILDDIERLLEFVSIGPRFSNVILQTILVLLKRIPPKGRKLLVIGTSSLEDEILESMTLLDAFNVHLNVPNLKPSDMKQVLEEIEVFDPADIDDAMPIKRLLMLIEMAAQGGDKGVSDHQEYEGNQEYEGHQEHEGKEKIKLDYFYECLHGINT
ncbi:unnamed protein product [Sphagnum troendelagicum]|uniref:Vesicle-fusing ATPase n=1 Tax=Sphagnum troendelagicum TaxID=128251 RepID=A0ABP0UM96_9BRYO